MQIRDLNKEMKLKLESLQVMNVSGYRYPSAKIEMIIFDALGRFKLTQCSENTHKII